MIMGEDVDRLDKIRENFHGDWNKRSFVFVDYSHVDSGLAPEGKYVGAICTADSLEEYEGLDEEAYRARKEEIADILVARLERQFPGIKKCIEYREVATARTIRRYTLNPAGAPYGFAQLPRQVGWMRPSYRSPIPNLWLCGTWTFPGGGFTGAIVSGFLCGLKVARKLEDTPSAVPSESRDERIVPLLERKQIAENTLELIVEKPEGFAYKPGQYAYVQLNAPRYRDLDMPLRSLSIASHPDEAHLRFIMRTGNSSYKKSCEALDPGDLLTIFGPDGGFGLRDEKSGMVFLTGGIGITPVFPMLRELEKRKYNKPVKVICCHHDLSGVVGNGILHNPSLANYTCQQVITGQEGRITCDYLKEHIDHPLEQEYYVVGSNGFLESMTGHLLSMGVRGEDILTDDFG
jgi:ferredoxin-NADP reductase